MKTLDIENFDLLFKDLTNNFEALGQKHADSIIQQEEVRVSMTLSY